MIIKHLAFSICLQPSYQYTMAVKQAESPLSKYQDDIVSLFYAWYNEPHPFLIIESGTLATSAFYVEKHRAIYA